jgi:hypothetical protein
MKSGESDAPLALVRHRELTQPRSEVTPSGNGYGFVPTGDGSSRSVGVTKRSDALYFEQHEDYVVEWLEEEAPL